MPPPWSVVSLGEGALPSQTNTPPTRAGDPAGVNTSSLQAGLSSFSPGAACHSASRSSNVATVSDLGLQPFFLNPSGSVLLGVNSQSVGHDSYIGGRLGSIQIVVVGRSELQLSSTTARDIHVSAAVELKVYLNGEKSPGFNHCAQGGRNDAVHEVGRPRLNEIGRALKAHPLKT